MKKLLFTTQKGVLCLFFILFCSVTSLLAQNSNVSGKITDAENEPLVGATVLVKGTTNGTTTNTEGAFSLDNVAKGSTLVVSFVGFLPKEVAADGNLTISLQESGTLGELVVTAENRSVSAQTVPISMDLVSGKTLLRQGITDLAGLQNLAPGLSIVTNTVFNQIVVRGVGSHDGAAELSDQAVTVGIDGEYINRPVALNAAMFDLDRVEVLKGPQGTLYGRNATAGAINIIAKKPTDRTEIDVNATYGNYNTIKTNAVVNLPLGKKAAFRVAGMLSKHDGYRQSSGTGAYVGGLDNGNVWAVRAGLMVNPIKNLSIYVAGEYNKTDQLSNSAYGVNMTAEAAKDTTLKGQAPTKWTTTLPKDFPVATAGFLKNDQGAVRTKITYDLGKAKLTYSGGYRDVELLSYQPLNGFIPETFSFHNDLKYQTQSHELRINGESNKLIWQAGVFHGSETQNVARGLILAAVKGAFGGKAPFNNFFIREIDSKTTGVFGQATYQVTEKFGITAGLRNTWDDKNRTASDLAAGPMPPNANVTRFFYPEVPTSMTQTGMRPTASTLPNSGSWNKLTYLLNFDYKIDDSKMVFAKWSTGYKAGGFDNIGNYDEENLRAIEIGTKNKFLDNRLRLNASVFNYAYQGQQVSVFISTAVGSQIKNAGNSSYTGVEFDGEMAFTKADRVKFTINYLDASFGDFTLDRQRIATTTEKVNVKGNSPIQAPKWTLIAGYDHDFEIGGSNLNVGVQTMYKSDYFLSPFNFEMDRQKAFTKTDAFITYTAKNSNWDIGVFAQNLEDNRVITNTSFNGANINGFSWIFGSPRLFGLQANYHFRGTRK
ncbi:MAG: TonB-dependent receptor [Saprospiraceae bacterium]|nr:TonB-dependent receptor [Saprospiraceae bacterium]